MPLKSPGPSLQACTSQELSLSPFVRGGLHTAHPRGRRAHQGPPHFSSTPAFMTREGWGGSSSAYMSLNVCSLSIPNSPQNTPACHKHHIYLCKHPSLHHEAAPDKKRKRETKKNPSGFLPSTLLTAVAMNQCKRHINSATKRHIYC